MNIAIQTDKLLMDIEIGEYVLPSLLDLPSDYSREYVGCVVARFSGVADDEDSPISVYALTFDFKKIVMVSRPYSRHVLVLWKRVG